MCDRIPELPLPNLEELRKQFPQDSCIDGKGHQYPPVVWMVGPIPCFKCGGAHLPQSYTVIW